MRPADLGGHFMEAGAVMAPIANQLLTKVNHFVCDGGEQRGGMALALRAHPDQVCAVLETVIRGELPAPNTRAWPRIVSASSAWCR